MLNDISHWWGNDVSSNATGDLQTANLTNRGQQRVLRRLLTNPGDYIFQPTYGAGLAQWVGQLMDIAKVTSLIKSQIALEDSVAKTPAPQITIQQNPADLSGFAVVIAYNDATNNTPTVLSFNVSK
jgi:phage baseplate assembly protein W